MKGLFNKVEVKSRSSLSKADKKKYNAQLGDILDIKETYTVLQISTKLKLVRNTEKFLFFEYYGRVYPAIQNFDKNLFGTVLLDEGAVEPLSRGADVMAPGVIKYKEQSCRFKKNDVVGVEIINRGVFGVGLCLMDFEEMLMKKEGPVIEMYHIKNDCLNKNQLI